MGMAERKGQGVRLVLRGLLGQGKQNTDHMLHLDLVRPSGPDHREFHGLGAVLVDLYPALQAGAQHGPPGLAYLERRLRVPGEDELLHRHLMGSMLGHQGRHPVVDGPQALGPGLVPDPDAATGDAQAALTVGIDDPEAGGAGSGVYTQDAMAQPLVRGGQQGHPALAPRHPKPP